MSTAAGRRVSAATTCSLDAGHESDPKRVVTLVAVDTWRVAPGVIMELEPCRSSSPPTMTMK
jgi:hypothetical protein